MNSFDAALELVEAKLRDLHARGVALRASSGRVTRLRLSAARETASAVGTTRITESAGGMDSSQASPTVSDKAARLATLRDTIQACVRCAHLVRSRTQVVVGIGDPSAQVMFVGEAPGEDEDRQG